MNMSASKPSAQDKTNTIGINTNSPMVVTLFSLSYMVAFIVLMFFDNQALWMTFIIAGTYIYLWALFHETRKEKTNVST